MTEFVSSYGILAIYIAGQAAVAVVAPLLTYWLTKPHLDRVAAKADIVAERVAEVAVQTNGQSARLEEFARQSGFIAGQAEEKANPT